jgi:hypothetical protein
MIGCHSVTHKCVPRLRSSTGTRQYARCCHSSDCTTHGDQSGDIALPLDPLHRGCACVRRDEDGSFGALARLFALWLRGSRTGPFASGCSAPYPGLLVIVFTIQRQKRFPTPPRIFCLLSGRRARGRLVSPPGNVLLPDSSRGCCGRGRGDGAPMRCTRASRVRGR